MEESILNSTKKILGLEANYVAFDLDVITHINAAFSLLNQLGVGPEEGFYISDKTDSWDDFDVPDNQLSLVKTYIYLKVRILFDPPSTSFLLETYKNQIQEYEWRLNTFSESGKDDPSIEEVNRERDDFRISRASRRQRYEVGCAE